MVTTFNKLLDSKQLRKTILLMAKSGSAVHIGCSFSLIEIVAVLYEKFIKLNWNDFQDTERDILALSKGHGVMALYACFKEFGWITHEDLLGYFGPSNHLKGLSSVHVKGIEVSGGSLGHGLSVSVGMAKGIKNKNQNNRVYCIVGDGEMNEGSMWESLLFASHHKLDNLTIIVDNNDFQAMGTIKDVMDLGNLKAKFDAFGFDSESVSGHDRDALFSVFSKLNNLPNGKPKVVIAKTIKGKGVSFMENNNAWHYSRLNDDLYANAIKEIENA
ncbi:MAG: transketolase [Methylococcaceae bacterium]